jgi:hypothetical protein
LNAGRPRCPTQSRTATARLHGLHDASHVRQPKTVDSRSPESGPGDPTFKCAHTSTPDVVQPRHAVFRAKITVLKFHTQTRENCLADK